MPSDAPKAPPSLLPRRHAGKTFLLAGAARFADFMARTARLLQLMDGEIVTAPNPGLDYLIVFAAPGDSPPPEAQAVADLVRDHGTRPTVLDGVFGLHGLLFLDAAEATALLRGGEEGAAAWRERRGDSRDPIDLSGIDLRGAALANLCLHGVRLDGADLRGADLSHTSLGHLVNVNLDGATLAHGFTSHYEGCSVRGADLTGTRFNPATVIDTDFSGSKLTRVMGDYTQGERVVFRRSDLARAMFSNSTLRESDFAGADLTGACFDDCDLTGSCLAGTILVRTSLTRARLTDADLTGADLSHANLAGADLTGARIDRAVFTGANLYAARLGELDLARAVGLGPVSPVPEERIGPALRGLEALAADAGWFEVSLCIDPDRRGENRVSLHVRVAGEHIQGSSSGPHGDANCQATTLSGAMLELAVRWADADLYLETIGLSGARKSRRKGLAELALAAWHEAFARPLPTQAERKAAQVAARSKFLARLGGPEGVHAWNAVRTEALRRAGHFRRSVLAGLDLTGINLGPRPGSGLEGLDFRGSDFDGSVLAGASLRAGDFIRSSFRNARLDGGDLGGGNFREADFQGASLRECDLRLAQCRWADFRGADLRGADFGDADLCGADLSTADIDGTTFEDTKCDASTKFPEGRPVPTGVNRGEGDGDRENEG